MKDEKMEPKVEKALAELRPTPARDPAAAARGRAVFLAQAAAARKQAARQPGWFGSLFSARPRMQRRWTNALIAAFLSIAVFFGGTATTVYAAQDSLPDQSLYPVKTWSEDAILSLTASPQARLNYTLDFTDRRIREVAELLSNGKAVPERVFTRLQDQLEQVLNLVAGMDDPTMIQDLEQIRLRAEAQLQTVAELMAGAPRSDQPILLQTHMRLQEQVQLCAMGETNPGGFKLQIQQRQQYRGGRGSGLTPTPDGNAAQTPTGQTPSETPLPSGGGYGPGQGGNEATGTPGQYGPGQGGAQPTGTPGHYGPGPGSGGQEQTPQQGGGSGKGP